MIRSVVLGCLLLQTAATYPSTFPFDLGEFESLPEATPDFTFSETDPGGYFRLGEFCDLNDFADHFEDDYVMIPFDCKNYLHRLNYLGMATRPQKGLWNCSYIEPVSASQIKDASRLASGQTAECVDYVDSTPMIFNTLDFLDPILVAAGCPQAPESALCLEMFQDQQFCEEQITSLTERVMILPCGDNIMRFLLSCPAFVIPIAYESQEPEQYYISLSAAQSITLYGLRLNSDRVCYPYSYYYGDESSNDDGSTANGDNDDNEQTVEESASVHGMFAFNYFM